MFTTQFVSYPESVVNISRRSGLVALVAAALAAVLIAVSLGSGNVGHSTTSLPQVRDMAPAWNQGHVTPMWNRIAPVGPASVAVASSTTARP